MNNFKNAKNIIYLVIIALSVIAIIILACGYLKNQSTAQNDSSTEISTVTLKQRKDKVLVTTSTETIQDGLEGMGILMTQEYYFTQIGKLTKEKKILEVIPSSSELMYSYDGKVMAGVDFTGIEVKMDDAKKTITVKMPASEIQTVTVDKDTFKKYSEKDSLWNPIKMEDYNLSLSEFEADAKKKALDSGILERSDEQARNLVQNFIRSFPSANGYDITFE